MRDDQDLQALVCRLRDWSLSAVLNRASEAQSELAEAADALERLSQELADSQDRVAGIHKLAKVLSLEDVVNGPVEESEVVMRLRLFEAIATLRVELATNKGQPKLVQAVCDAAAANLVRAEAAEARLTASRGTCNSCRFFDPGFSCFCGCKKHIAPGGESPV